MLQEWSHLFAPAVQDRICLLLNHVIGREPVAVARLAPHAGRAVIVHLRGWPSLLPAAPDLVLSISRAGLLERLDEAPADALRIEVDASNPALLALGSLSGEKPQVSVQGDAALAGDISWLMDNLRWDIEDDLAALVGPMAAYQLARWGRAAAQGLAALARTAASFAPGAARGGA
jgi:ubiquinone biosynthesis accessory factor UbiJ